MKRFISVLLVMIISASALFALSGCDKDPAKEYEGIRFIYEEIVADDNLLETYAGDPYRYRDIISFLCCTVDGAVLRLDLLSLRLIAENRRLSQDALIKNPLLYSLGTLFVQKLLQAAYARQANPESSLTELAGMMEPPITKPAMNNRMKKLLQLAMEAKK